MQDKSQTSINKLKGEIALHLGSDSFKLTPSFNNLVKIEAQTGLSLIELASLMQKNQLPLKKMVIILQCAIEPELSSQALEGMLTEYGLVGAYEAVAYFLVEAINPGSMANNEKNG